MTRTTRVNTGQADSWVWPVFLTVRRLVAALVFAPAFGFTPLAHPAADTTVPISAALGTNIAAGLFPVTLKLPGINLRLTDPALQYLDAQRVGLQAQFQAYDYRPVENTAISETGRAIVTGELGFDPRTREVLLHNPRLDALEFDRKSALTQRLSNEVKAAWSGQVTNPIRSELPPHPYLLPFRDYITNLFYDGKNIILVMRYQ